jgi:hypothetical protein
LKVLFQHFPIEENQCAQRLVLRGRCNFSINRKVVQELLHFWRSHFCRVFFSVKVDISFNPVDISCLSAQAVMFAANRLTHPVEEFGLITLGRQVHSSLEQLVLFIAGFRNLLRKALQHLI